MPLSAAQFHSIKVTTTVYSAEQMHSPLCSMHNLFSKICLAKPILPTCTLASNEQHSLCRSRLSRQGKWANLTHEWEQACLALPSTQCSAYLMDK